MMNEETAPAPESDARKALGKALLALIPVVAIGMFFAFSEASPEQLAQRIPHCPPVVFFLFGALAPLVGFPLAPLYVYAGIKYGFAEGFALCVPMVALNLAIAHPVYGRLLRRPVLAMLARRGWNPETMRHGNRVRMTFVIASLPALPFWAQNATLAALAVPFPLFFSISLGLQSIFAAGMVSLGALGTKMPAWCVPVVVGLVVLTIGISLHFKMRRGRGA